MKRILILISVASIVISLFAVTAFGADTTVNGYTVIDYNDYVANLKVDGDNDIVTVTLPDNMYSITQLDINGSDYRLGLSSGVLRCIPNSDVIENAGVFCPSGAVNKTYLSLSNIPDGAVFTTTNKISIEPEAIDPYGIFEVKYRSRVAYFDSNFELIKNETSPAEELLYVPNEWEYELEYEVAINKPDEAMYCMTYFWFEVVNAPYNDQYVSKIYYEFAKPKLQMSISSLYRLQEQTGRTNQILGDIEDAINGEATPEAPENSESVGDLSDLEDSLTQDTEQGREEAEIVFNESTDIILSHIQGFFFLGMVIEWFIGVGWIRGVLTISLSLGIFAFIVNIASNLGKSIEHRSKGNSGKGG